MKKKVNSFTAIPLKACVVAIAFITMIPSSLPAASSGSVPKERETRLIEGAKKEGKLAFWCATTARDMEPVFKKFNEKYPFLHVEYWRANSTDIRQKMISEASAGVYNPDCACTDMELLVDMKKADLMKKHDWPNAKTWIPDYKDPEGGWVARHLVLVVIGYNTQLVPSAEAPKDYKELLAPKWKGQVLIPKDYDWVGMMWAVWGKEKTVAYLRELSKNNPVIGGGHSSRTELIAAGANKIDIRLSLNTLLEFQGKGAPLDWVRTDPIFGKGTPIFIAKHAPHPNAAILFADWYTSLQGQQAYGDANGYMMPHPGVKSAITESIRGRNIAMMPASMAAHGNEIAKLYAEIFYK